MSDHYLPPSDWSDAPSHFLERLHEANIGESTLILGSTSTTDVPFRETEEAIASASAPGILAVEMDAAGLYAVARAKNRNVICLAHMTNQMG